MQRTTKLLASAIGDWQVELRQVVMGVLTALLIAHTHTQQVVQRRLGREVQGQVSSLGQWL